MTIASSLARAASAFALALAPLAARPAAAQPTPEPAQYLGHVQKDIAAATSFWDPSPPAAEFAGNVYANVATSLHVGISSTALGSTWGDRVTTTGTGTLLETDFTVFNSPSSAGPLLSATFELGLYDPVSFARRGSFTTGAVGFGAGLPPGAFTIVTATGLSSLGLRIDSRDVLLVQRITATTGTASRLGVVFYDPPSLGASAPSMYVDSPTIGPAGWYTLPGQSADPGYRIAAGDPVPARPATWGRVKALYGPRSR